MSGYLWIGQNRKNILKNCKINLKYFDIIKIVRIFVVPLRTTAAEESETLERE